MNALHTFYVFMTRPVLMISHAAFVITIVLFVGVVILVMAWFLAKASIEPGTRRPRLALVILAELIWQALCRAAVGALRRAKQPEQRA